MKAGPLDRDVLMIACALCRNPEAVKAASVRHDHEFVMRVDPCETLADLALAIVRRLREGQLTL